MLCCFEDESRFFKLLVRVAVGALRANRGLNPGGMHSVYRKGNNIPAQCQRANPFEQ